ncbi:XRE family transcriptional regulator [Henriciella barbarensis]|jgi:transcriptional regulator with XRE-family HTH domain|uniref:XRE family transcriptional regulator n=1 Tax=Henriciella barbarensis TaxID=86342 RepID=A0A399R361_9PROT|nr:MULTISPECIES: helix-turn-helix transcriptional regulator [Henriciella]RIJ24665.1 XRE family transcriptional regulator [Henriciella barbarensis]
MSDVKMGFAGPENEKERLQRKLKEAREYLGMSQAKVAEFLQIQRSAVSEIESGKRAISALELRQLARLYQKPTSWFTDEVVEGVPADVEFLARTATELSQTDRGELQKFAEFLKAKSKVGDGNP